MKKILVALSLILALNTQTTLADSPLTSTQFHDSYQDVPAVKQALKDKKLTPALATYLTNSSVSLDKRLAVVSALGWQFEGQKNAERFLSKVKGDTWFYSRDWKQLSPDHLILLAYLSAMDNYFDVKDEHAMASRARQADPDNSALAVIASLIEGQAIMELNDTKEWPRIWAVAEKALKMKGEPRLRAGALETIRKYMALYDE